MIQRYRKVFSIIVLFNLLSSHIVPMESKSSRIQKRFSMKDVCKEAIKTVNQVNGCPMDKETTQRRSREFNCTSVRDSCTSEEMVYHCVRSGNRILEVCAPRYYVTGRYCVQFDDKIGRVIEDYKVTCPECPFQHYSNESITYSTCSNFIQSLAVVRSTTSETYTITTFSMKSTHEITDTLLVTKNCSSTTGRHKRHADCNQNADFNRDESLTSMTSNRSNTIENNLVKYIVYQIVFKMIKLHIGYFP